MRAWTSPDVPRLDLPPADQVHLFDTSRGALVPTDPGPTARLYVCGITPYDATHIGHAATYVGFDLLNRSWRDAGHRVHYVQNVTDVDDPLLERAAATGEPWADLAERETQLFREDMEALRVLAPDDYVGAVEAIPLIVPMIERLADLGAVYEVEGDLYFSVRSDPAFGSVSGLDEATMLTLSAERGGDPDRPGKKDPLDCLVWQAERAGEPAWDSALGRGRPGWHVECAAIALEHLGSAFDVQGGGSDLVFPHHEMSASEAQALHDGAAFAQAYAHAGMVAYQGEKMSKSKGNLVLVSQLREAGVDPMAVRLALCAHHYRADWEWTDQDLARGAERLDTWRAALRACGSRPDPVSSSLVDAVRVALADDLDAPRALAAVDAWAAYCLAEPEPGDGPLVRHLLDARLGVLL